MFTSVIGVLLISGIVVCAVKRSKSKKAVCTHRDVDNQGHRERGCIRTPARIALSFGGTVGKFTIHQQTQTRTILTIMRRHKARRRTIRPPRRQRPIIDLQRAPSAQTARSVCRQSCFEGPVSIAGEARYTLQHSISSPCIRIVVGRHGHRTVEFVRTPYCTERYLPQHAECE